MSRKYRTDHTSAYPREVPWSERIHHWSVVVFHGNSMIDMSDIQDWIIENGEGWWAAHMPYRYRFEACFSSERDAILYKLRWC